MKSSVTSSTHARSAAFRARGSNAHTPLTHAASDGASPTMVAMLNAYYGKEKEPAPRAARAVTIRRFSWEG